MGTVTGRTSQTSRGWLTISPWIENNFTYTISQLDLGNNSISKLEVVSALNSFNLGYDQYHFNYSTCTKKYNPKVYLSAVQSVAYAWNYDQQNTEKWASNGHEKSGSWPLI